jgi:hypothetical protein
MQYHDATHLTDAAVLRAIRLRAMLRQRAFSHTTDDLMEYALSDVLGSTENQRQFLIAMAGYDPGAITAWAQRFRDSFVKTARTMPQSPEAIAAENEQRLQQSRELIEAHRRRKPAPGWARGEKLELAALALLSVCAIGYAVFEAFWK